MNKQSDMNKKAWSYKAEEFWHKHLGQPEQVAKDMLYNPNQHIRRHSKYFGELDKLKVINPLGSCGKKAIPLAILGSEVTIIDISEENKNYAKEVAKYAGVDIEYIVSDLMELEEKRLENYFDLVYMEGGILHYFSDIEELAKKIYSFLNKGGKLVLNDFHPFRKVLKNRDVFNDELELSGDYFESETHIGDVAYQRFYDEEEQKKFPKCKLRYWTIGEIITAFAKSGFRIEEFEEFPRYDNNKWLPGEFTLVAIK